MAPSRQHHRRCSSDPSPLLTGPFAAARRTHRRCSPDPSPLLARPIASTLSLSPTKSTHLQALTPPSLAINASVQHRCFDEYRYKFFFTKSEKNRRNKPKQNDISHKFSNWRRFLAKFLDISTVDISPSSFVSLPAKTRNFTEISTKKTKIFILGLEDTILIYFPIKHYCYSFLSN